MCVVRCTRGVWYWLGWSVLFVNCVWPLLGAGSAFIGCLASIVLSWLFLLLYVSALALGFSGWFLFARGVWRKGYGQVCAVCVFWRVLVLASGVYPLVGGLCVDAWLAVVVWFVSCVAVLLWLWLCVEWLLRLCVDAVDGLFQW